METDLESSRTVIGFKLLLEPVFKCHFLGEVLSKALPPTVNGGWMTRL